MHQTQNTEISGPLSPHRRHHLLINKDFQLRYLVIAVSLVIILINVTAIASFLVLGPPVTGGLPWLDLFLLVAVEVIVLGLTVWSGLKITHAIVGPLYVLNHAFKHLEAGDLSVSIKFRHTDHFQDTADAFNQAVSGLRHKVETIQDACSEIGTLGNTGDAAELEKRMENVKQALSSFKLGSND